MDILLWYSDVLNQCKTVHVRFPYVMIERVSLFLLFVSSLVADKAASFIVHDHSLQISLYEHFGILDVFRQLEFSTSLLLWEWQHDTHPLSSIIVN